MKEQMKIMNFIDLTRKECKLTIRDICHMANITEGTYHNAKQGKNRIAYVDVIELCQFLNIKNIEI